MPKFRCSYAFDVPHYVDFIVEAENEGAAQSKMQHALDAGTLGALESKARPFYENSCNERVFVSEQADADDTEDTMEELIRESLCKQ